MLFRKIVGNNKLSKIESKITESEKELKEIDVELETNYDQTVSDPDFFDRYQKKKDALQALMLEWETIQEEIENLSWWKNIFFNVRIAGKPFLY